LTLFADGASSRRRSSYRPKSASVDDRLGFCGQPDLIGSTKSRGLVGLIDFKTSISFEKWFRLQGAAYRHLAKVAGIETTWGGNLRLRPDGSMPLFDAWEDYQGDFNRFLGALNLHYFFNR
jgi:hypothetical protein